MRIFDGQAAALQHERTLQLRVTQLTQRGVKLHIAAILFVEDAGSRLYSQLKQEAAHRIGIEYTLYSFSLLDSTEKVQQKITQLNVDSAITGIIVQKPWTSLWTSVTHQNKTAFAPWWQSIVQTIKLEKDVDGLHPQTLLAIQRGTWRAEGRVLPATARAVLAILESEKLVSQDKKYIIIGKSDLLGKPLSYALKNKKCNVELIGTAELELRIEQQQFLLDADVLISATGHRDLVTGNLLKDNVTLIDVGEPSPDIERSSVAEKATFLTPVPGGVGPMTVVSLMANAVDLLV